MFLGAFPFWNWLPKQKVFEAAGAVFADAQVSDMSTNLCAAERVMGEREKSAPGRWEDPLSLGREHSIPSYNETCGGVSRIACYCAWREEDMPFSLSPCATEGLKGFSIPVQ